MKRALVAFALLLTLVVAIVPIAGASAASQILGAPRIKVKESDSLNWAGYAVETNLINPQSGAVSDVKGQWLVPAVNCTQSSTLSTPRHGKSTAKGTTAYSSTWVGIDGYSDGTVEQIGTEQDCISGQPYYYAWYEMYPQMPVKLSMPIKSGDIISAEVQFSTGFALSLTESDPAGTNSFTTNASNNAQRSSAEWIVEAPSSGRVLPLANFGTVQFKNATATLNGATGVIDNPAWQNDPLTMVTKTGTIKASPSPLSDNTLGSSFGVTWSHN